MIDLEYRVVFEPAGIALKANPGETLMDLLAGQTALPLRTDCGGTGVCGKCRVLVSDNSHLSPLTDTEKYHITDEDLKKGMRLACQASVRGPLTVTLAGEFTGEQQASGKADIGGGFSVNPAAVRHVVPPGALSFKGEPGNMGSLEYLAREFSFLKSLKDCRGSSGGIDTLRELAASCSFREETTMVVHETNGLTSVLSGRRERSLGFAFDVGTTTIAAYLCDLKSGEIVATQSAVNPQRGFGEDVISRISAANTRKSGLETLSGLVAQGVCGLMDDCLEQAGAHILDIDDVVFAGNTAMQLILAGISPRSLGEAPYLPISREAMELKAGDLGLHLKPSTGVYLFPAISGFVGGDTVSVILAGGLHRERDVVLCIDIGTNGEIVLTRNGKLFTTSCATGPAFEGAQISCGMRAAPGAISHVEIDPVTCEVSLTVIGEGVSPSGICGSGIIDVIASMRRAGIIGRDGRFCEGKKGVITGDGASRFVLVPPNESGREISVTLKDIRQVQLAKAALETGILLLMKKAGVTRLDRTILTGAFGAVFNWKNALDIGMIPESVRESEVVPMVNLAGRGAVMALLDKDSRREVDGFMPETVFLELAGEADFTKQFMDSSWFPELEV